MVSLVNLRRKVQTHLHRAAYQVEALVAGRGRHARPSALEARIVDDLRTEGVHVTTLKVLLPELAETLRQSFAIAETLVHAADVKEPARIWRRGSASTDLRAHVLLELIPELYLLGLHPRVLAVAQRYLRLPVAYHGAVVRHSLMDGIVAGPRLWHQDKEDFHVLRMVVYLNDVSVGGGPFEYIPRSVKLTYKSFSGIEKELTDARMREVVPVAAWRRVYGPAGTVILADTAQVFHHESLQIERARAVIMLGYSSRRPKSLNYAMAHFPVEELSGLLHRLVPKQNHPHVFSWRQTAPSTEPP